MFRKIALVFMAGLLLTAAAQDTMLLDWGSPMVASETPAPPTHLSVEAVASVQSYRIGGTPFFVALQVQAQQGWHAYYRNPATVGEAMTAQLEAPQGFEVRGPFWQVPTREQSAVGTAYIYEAPLIVWELTPTAAAPEGATFRLSGTAQLCSEEGCLPPETAAAELQLSAGDGAPNPAWAQQQQRVEVLGDTPLSCTAEQASDGSSVTLHFTGAPQGLQHAYFFSDDNSIDPAAEQQLNADGAGGYTLSLPRNKGDNPLTPLPADAAAPGSPLPELRGLLTWDGGHSRVAVAPSLLSGASGASTGGAALSMGSLATICGSLFLGGLILNLMPCVFPVIGLKVMSFVKLGGGSRRRVVAHSLVFAGGILLSFWAIAAALLLLTDPATRSWALWMQNAWVVYGITLLLLLLALSMSGVFEIGLSATAAGQGLQSRGGLAGSFFQGLLITVVATPCSAPFLGSAMPLALALPAAGMVTALTAMALGLALPYLVLGCFPSLVARLPRPGEWMESLKLALSFLMYAAAAWFLFVYLQFADVAQGPWIMVGMVLVAAAAWVYGRWFPPYRSRTARTVGGIAMLLLLAAGLSLSLPKPHSDWQEWSPAAMEAALEEGSPVFVDFTAQWCATCQYNKQFAYSDAVYALLRRHHVVLMRADMTAPSPSIANALRRLRRSNVPVNALYLPDAEPSVTPELLTPDSLEQFLREHLRTDEP
ncbi:MAG: protein-disulfide reductase DsbD family protein [Akkermansia sp.]